MLLAGLWHGANWIFVLWGAYHGALLILYRVVPALRSLGDEKTSSHLRGVLAVALMWVFTLAGWAIFRSPNLHQLGGWLAALGHWQTAAALPWVSSAIWLLIHVAPLILLQLLTWKHQDETNLGRLTWPARGLVYALMVMLILSSTEHDIEFIYFQF
jgi:D-alanyl-lipoteichoic acid acyltransferase DltB (MBOAT superfamily)